MGETLVAFKPRPQSRSTTHARERQGARSRFRHNRQDRTLVDLSAIKVRIADTTEDREQAYRLRYQVYCVENDFEPAALHRDGRETDAYDDQSVHGLVMYRTTATAIGTARLILPPRDSDELPLPTPQICARYVLASHAHIIPTESTAELSRFAISKAQRQRRAVRRHPDRQIPGAPTRQVVSTISLGLMQAAIAMARTNGISHLYALMEPALLRMLRGLGIHFEPLGPVVDYHGHRQPCFCDLDQLLNRTLAERPDIWTIITDEGQLWPRPPAEIVDLGKLAPSRVSLPVEPHTPRHTP